MNNKNEQIRIIEILKNQKIDLGIPSSQVKCMTSFIPLSTPVHGVYGLFKLRCVAGSDEEIQEKEKFIINNIDQTHTLWTGDTGKWLLLTTNTDFSMNVEAYNPEEDAAKEAEKNNEINKEINRTIRGSENLERMRIEKIQKECEERQRELEEDVLRPEDPDSIDNYIQLHVKKAQFTQYLDDNTKKLHNVKLSLDRIRDDISTMNKKFPKYKFQAKEKYLETRRSVGISDDAYDPTGLSKLFNEY